MRRVVWLILVMIVTTWRIVLFRAFLLGLMLCRGIILSLRNLSRIASRRGLGRICPLFIIKLLSILTHVIRTMGLIF